jgi:hypothetical protein
MTRRLPAALGRLILVLALGTLSASFLWLFGRGSEVGDEPLAQTEADPTSSPSQSASLESDLAE